MFDRIIGVFKLDSNTFEEIEHDSEATSQAVIVVTIVALIGAIGSGLGASFTDTSFLGSFFSTLIWTFAGWFLWSLISFFVGTTFFGGQADLGEMLRVIGFANAPQVLSIIPCIGWLIGSIWSLIAVFIAIRQGLDLDNTKAFLTIVIGFFVYVVGRLLISLFVSGTTALLGF